METTVWKMAKVWNVKHINYETKKNVLWKKSNRKQCTIKIKVEKIHSKQKLKAQISTLCNAREETVWPAILEWMDRASKSRCVCVDGAHSFLCSSLSHSTDWLPVQFGLVNKYKIKTKTSFLYPPKSIHPSLINSCFVHLVLTNTWQRFLILCLSISVPSIILRSFFPS